MYMCVWQVFLIAPTVSLRGQIQNTKVKQMLRLHIGVILPLKLTRSLGAAGKIFALVLNHHEPTHTHTHTSLTVSSRWKNRKQHSKTNCASKLNCTCTPTSDIQRSVPIIKY